MKYQTENLVEQAKDVAERGKSRKIALFANDGKQLLETNLTVVTVAAAVLLISGFLTWPLLLIAGIAGYSAKLRVEFSAEDATTSVAVES